MEEPVPCSRRVKESKRIVLAPQARAQRSGAHGVRSHLSFMTTSTKAGLRLYEMTSVVSTSAEP